MGAAFLMAAALGRVPSRDLAGVFIYSAGMIAMFTASAGYNLIQRPRLKDWLRRMDHSAIFVMIAGSYTPFALKIDGAAGHAILAAVWLIAAFGIVVKLFFPRRLERVSVLIYLAQGWCVLFALGPLTETLPGVSLNLLVAGGVVYSAGVVFHLWESMRFHNVIWHVFVLGGAVLQYGAVYAAVIP